MFSRGLFQNWQFFHLFILGKIGQEIVFHDTLKRKNTPLDYVNKKLKKSKNWDFSIGVVHCFGHKLAILACFQC